MRPQGEEIRCYINKAISVEATMAHSLEVKVLSIGTLNINLISTRVCLVGPFRKYLRLLIRVILIIMTLVDRAVVSF